MKKDDINTKATYDFMNYASAVISNRAIPAAEDNLKPVNRRILYSMYNMKLWSSGKTVKSAKIVGQVLGTLHPHGDSSVYEAMIHMSQSWKMRYPLVQVQGNNGSLNGDPAAASRYTEAKLTPAGEYLLKNLDEDTIKFIPNYDNTIMEPTLLPSIFPNVLCNGSLGIAVGMSCSLLPHNLNEVSDLLVSVVEGKTKDIKDAMKILKGPDFPLGGIVMNGQELEEAYRLGRGTVILRAKNVIDTKNNTITFSEFPYLVDVETRIIKAIKDLVLDGNADIENVENHIGKDVCNIKVILNKKANPDKVLQLLYDKTPLQKTIKLNNTVILDGVPITLGLLGLCNNYISHQHKIIIKAAEKEKQRQDHIAHINRGLTIATLNIDNVILIIRQSESKQEARTSLINSLGIDSEQADAILALQLGRLTKLDVNDIQAKIEKAEKESKIQLDIVNNKETRDSIIISNLKEIKRLFGDDRRTTINYASENAEKEENNSVVVFVDKSGRIEEIEPQKFADSFKKGGFLHKSKPLMWKYNCGFPYAILNSNGTTSKEFNENSKSIFLWDKTKKYIVSVSKNGIMKKTPMIEYKKVDKICKVKKDDYIINAFCCNDDDSIVVLLSNGKAQAIKVEDIKTSTKMTIGAKVSSDSIIEACCVEKGGLFYTIDAENHCKRCSVSELSKTAVSVGESCIHIGAAVNNMFWYDGSKMNEINWENFLVKGKNAQGAKIGSKILENIG